VYRQIDEFRIVIINILFRQLSKEKRHD